MKTDEIKELRNWICWESCSFHSPLTFNLETIRHELTISKSYLESLGNATGLLLHPISKTSNRSSIKNSKEVGYEFDSSTTKKLEKQYSLKIIFYSLNRFIF
jgi:hypothetical protein